jgi:hypothetical protein
MSDKLYVVRNGRGKLVGAYPDRSAAESVKDANNYGDTITEYIPAPAETVEHCCGNCRWGRVTEPGRIQCDADYSLSAIAALMPESIQVRFSRYAMGTHNGTHCPKFQSRTLPGE